MTQHCYGIQSGVSQIGKNRPPINVMDRFLDSDGIPSRTSHESGPFGKEAAGNRAAYLIVPALPPAVSGTRISDPAGNIASDPGRFRPKFASPSAAPHRPRQSSPEAHRGQSW